MTCWVCQRLRRRRSNSRAGAPGGGERRGERNKKSRCEWNGMNVFTVSSTYGGGMYGGSMYGIYRYDVI